MRAIFFLLCFCLAKAAFADIIDKSEASFFPKEFAEQLERFRSFRTSWWGFLVFEKIDGPKLLSICGKLREAKLLDRLECGDNLEEMLPLAQDWASDLSLRENPLDRAALQRSFAASLTEASFPMPPPLLKLLRADPLRTYHKLLSHAVDMQPVKMEREGGVFHDPPTGRWLVPYRPNFPASDSDKTNILFNIVSQELPDTHWWAIGAHASARENRRQVQVDLERVSLVGTFLLIAYLIWVWRLKRLRLAWGIPMIFLGGGIGAAATILILGSIHGLVLSFGIGIMGLLLDYTIHGAFNSRSAHVWKSNLAGLLTTLTVFSVMAFSQIPLLRQLSVFSIVGLSVSYGLIYFLHHLFSKYLAVEPVVSHFCSSKVTFGLTALLGAGVVPAILWLPLKFDMRQFNFQSSRTQEIYQWLGKNLKPERPHLEVVDSAEAAYSRRDWALQEKISVENIAFYVPPYARQIENAEGWRQMLCPRSDFTATEKQFFAPFFEKLNCGGQQPLSITQRSPLPLYIRDMESGGKWLNVWFPSDDSEVTRLKEKYPEAVSLLEVVNHFPETVANEMKWMAPLSFFLIILVLWGYYRRLDVALMAMLPFCIGLGLIGWLRVFGMPFSFVSLIGMTMLLGLGVDYGVFAVDHALEKAVEANETSEGGLNSALLFAAITTIVGYVPLLFCRHQVLVHLGQILTFGTLGSTLGAFWAVPIVAKWLRPKKAEGKA